MDRLQFVNSINFTNECDFVKGAIKYFDHEMLLYNLVGTCNNIHIDGDPISPREMTFSVNFSSKEEAENMMQAVLSDGTRVNIYGKYFDIIVNGSTDIRSIEITLQKLN